MKAWLLKEDSEDFSQELIALPEGPARLTVGRAKDADVRFTSSRLARTQCQLVSDGERWWIEIDVSSSGGRRTSESPLRPPLPAWVSPGCFTCPSPTAGDRAASWVR